MLRGSSGFIIESTPPLEGVLSLSGVGGDAAAAAVAALLAGCRFLPLPHLLHPSLSLFLTLFLPFPLRPT